MQVKICGVTHPDDAYLAAKAGADYIGVIFSPASKRRVTLEQANEIKAAIHDTNVQLVGVFVNESAEQIDTICKHVSISTIQLHGGKSRSEMPYLTNTYSIFYVISKNNNHSFAKYIFPEHVIPLFDNEKLEQSEPFDWQSFTPPKGPWILAGGLNVDNVANAIALLNPSMVDVASGVERRDSIRKDYHLLQEFIEKAKRGVIS